MQISSPVSAVEKRQSSSAAPFPWVADNCDGTYKNPILFADYSDPDVIRVGDDFYLTASSFNCTPGLPILHSKDLVNWTLINYALKKLPHPRYDQVQHGCGVWAPAIRFHAGRFCIYFPMPDEGIFVTTATDPAGEWSEPHLMYPGKGLIDPCPFWDDDGNAYLVHAWAKSRSGIKSILTLHRMSPDGHQLLDEGRVVFDGNAHHPTIEGPKLYKRNGYYYIFAPAGGVKTGWQTVLRSKNIFGPYEERIVLAQGQTEINGPHQGGWVETGSGESWFVHFQDREAYGRIVHLQPVEWVADWPVIGVDKTGRGQGEPLPFYKKPNVRNGHELVRSFETSDDFNESQLDLPWQWQANSQPEWFSLTARRGWLRLHAAPVPETATNLWPVGNLLLQKPPAPEFDVITKLDCEGIAVGEQAGLVVMGMDYSALAVRRSAEGLRLAKVVCHNAHDRGKEIEEQSVSCDTGLVFLRLQVGSGVNCEFSYSSDGRKFVPLGKSFTGRAGEWIGAKVGLFCVAQNAEGSGYADFDFFRFSPAQS